MLCPQKIHVCLWLIVYNKGLTRDNLTKRRRVDDPSVSFVGMNQYNTFVSDFFQIKLPENFVGIIALWRMHKTSML